ncbi:Histidinol dehydrogenase [Anaerobiospirillum thomasii]|uniref:histidinol dehydrogenase n=1 Tax=Anaerobiospirillum thomasii TaxID=179995 RepID=UPI000D97219C|nr:histidinol dehydrogenase [Anaerobiospirillum thomasii]SPT67874.1 Histidinol dehydrogenase [Anaerobiospirillum thomasii]
MNIYNWSELSDSQKQQALRRPAQESSNDIQRICKEIIDNIREDGDAALYRYSRELDRFDGADLRISEQKIKNALESIDKDLKAAIDTAYDNIYAFHKAQQGSHIELETAPGIICKTKTHAIESVGLYVPGGSAPLVSTALMLSIPAKIAGCRQIIMCSPPPVSDAIIYAAHKAGVDKIFAIGGAQAIAAMAYGSDSVPKVLKIFGPGNQFVTMAKKLVSEDPEGAAIDMPAGPSEVLVIADKHADSSLVAADLLSQAEHGPDSQVIFVTDDKDMLDKVIKDTDEQLSALPRKDIARKALAKSSAILCKDLNEAVVISNTYAPEHLIIQTDNADELSDKCLNAGSIFVGAFTPESLGDYASGTNHTLPTYGYAKTASALGTDDYRRRYTVSKATAAGILNIATTVERLAHEEGLFAHKNAMTLRYKKALEK